MKKLVLVDGSSYLYRAFHALPDLRSSKGEPTNTLRGVIAMLRRLLVECKPDYFAVVFDAPGKTFRDVWYPDYKANRPPMPDDLGAQIPPLHEMVRAHGWPLLMMEGVEADDVIATLAVQAEQQHIACIISTSDKDLAQLVNPHITLINTMSNETLDEAGVRAKFGVNPEQILDYLSLIGDSVDNIPGVPKVGPKTAAKWLNDYGSLDNVIAHAPEIGGVVGENLRKTLSWLPEAKRLLAVKCDVALPFTIEDLVVQSADTGKLAELLTRYDFKAWLRELSNAENNATSSDETVVPDVTPTVAAARRYETILDEAGLDRWLNKIQSASLVCLDTETTSLDQLQARLVGLSFSITPNEAAYLPIAHHYAGAPEQLALQSVLEKLQPWLEDSTPRKLGQNIKYDQHVLANHGIRLRGIVHDTLLQSYVLESHKPHDMDNMALRHLDVQTIAYDAVTGKGNNRIAFDQVSVERATEYSAEDADVTLRLHQKLYPRLAADDKLRFIYEKIELPVREVLFVMERNGVLIDSAALRNYSQELGRRMLELEARVHQLAGQSFNLNSPKQLAEILFDRLQLPIKKKTATGQASTDEDVLQELAADYPLPKHLLEYRTLAKLKSTYTDKLPQMINPHTGRVHTNYGQAVAVTGRLSSNDPNLQNIPVRTAEGRKIRESFIAPAEHCIVSADYSQIELRIMAHLSEDQNLLRAFAEGADIHRATAAEIFSVPVDQVSAEQRRYIKAVNFGLIYGMSAFGLATQLGIERSAAQAYIDKYFARYPGVADYMQRTRELARAQGYVETVFGRRLWLTDIKAASGPRRQAAERAAINAPMQGTAADLIKLAMIEVQQWLEHNKLQSKLIMQVHDELVFEVPDSELTLVQDHLPKLMAQVAELRVPLVVDVGVGPNWERAH